MVGWLQRHCNTKYQAMWRPAKDCRMIMAQFDHEWEVDQFLERVREGATFSQTIRVSLVTTIPGVAKIEHNYQRVMDISPKVGLSTN